MTRSATSSAPWQGHPRLIQEETGASIEVHKDGNVFIASVDTGGEAARKMVEDIVKVPEVGEEYEGEVVNIQSFGAFVKLTPNKDGLLHISRVANGRVGAVEDVLSEGDTVKVKVIEVDEKTGKISLEPSRQAPMPPRAAPSRATTRVTATTVATATASATTGSRAAGTKRMRIPAS